MPGKPQPPFLVGQFLLAMPGIGDPRFERSIIAICSHDEEGALGIGIGSIHKGLSFHELLKQLHIDPGEAPDAPIHVGGPVEPQRGFVLHSQDWGGQDAPSVNGKWSLSSSQDVLKAIVAGKGPSQWMVALGYAGWAAGQLEGEMTRHGWHVADGDTSILFDEPVNSRWSRAFRSTGIDPALLSSTSGHA